jgi:hypothetical protein
MTFSSETITFSVCPWMANNDPDFDPIRQTDSFVNLVKQSWTHGWSETGFFRKKLHLSL